MSVNINTATVDAVVSVWVKLPKEVREKVIEATHRLIDFSNKIGKDTTGQVSGEINQYLDALSPEVFKGAHETLRVILENIE